MSTKIEHTRIELAKKGIITDEVKQVALDEGMAPEQLSKDIQKEYPGIQGFSTTNLWNMRLFYSEIQQHEKLQPLVGEISWTNWRGNLQHLALPAGRIQQISACAGSDCKTAGYC